MKAYLLNEKRKFGGYDDSQGRRYVIPQLYLRVEDYKGALRYFKWFEKEFEDDIGFPDFLLAWTITLFQNNKEELALKKAYQTAFSNIYLFDLLLGHEVVATDNPEFISSESYRFAEEILPDCLAMITGPFLTWLHKVTRQSNFKKNMREFGGLQRLIDSETNISERSKYLGLKKELVERLTT